jgi:hypothetical protein
MAEAGFKDPYDIGYPEFQGIKHDEQRKDDHNFPALKNMAFFSFLFLSLWGCFFCFFPCQTNPPLIGN